MTIFSLRHRRVRFALALTLLIPAALALAGLNALAATTTAKPDQQAYNWDGSPAPDPYASSGDSDLHVAMANGSTAAHTLIHLDFSALSQGAQINDLTLTLYENPNNNYDQANTAADQNPALRACVLTQPFTQQNTAAAYDCSKYPASPPADFDSAKNTWKFNLQSLAASWDKLGNTGAAIVPIAEALGGQGASNLPSNAVNWSLSFFRDKTSATIEYTGGSSSSSSFSSAPLPASSFSGGGLALSAPPPPVSVPPPAKAPLPAATTPNGAAAGSTGSVPLTKIQTQRIWVGIAAGLAVLALLLVVGGTGIQVLRAGSLSLPGVGGALGAAWPQVATPAAVILAGAVIAGGFSGRVVTVAAPGAVGAAASGGAGSAGAASGPALSGTAAGAGSGAGAGATASAATAGPAVGGANAAVAPGNRPLRIGFFHASNVNTINEANGINGLNNTGNDEAQANAMIDWINKHGGVGGHPLQAVFVNEDASNTDPNYSQQLCTQMTEDEQVFAVVDTNNADTKSLQCFYQHRTIVLNTGLTYFSASQLQAWQPYVWVTENPSLDRDMVEKLNALQQRGFFQPPDAVTKIKPGFVYPKDPDTEKIVSNLVIPYLHKLGFSDSQYDSVEIDGTSGNPGAVLAQINNAALKFDTDSVNRVFFVNDSGAALYAFFARDADNEKYVPRYGLSSQDGLDATGYLIPEDQKVNSIAVGYWPWTDTSQVNSVGFPDGASERLCYQIMNQHGIYSAEAKGHERDGEGTLTMEWQCDALWLLYYAGAKLSNQTLSAASLDSAIQSLGSSFQLSVTYPGMTYFGPRNLDPIDYYRFIRFDPSCTTGYDGGTGSPPQGCFKYDGTAIYRSPEV